MSAHQREITDDSLRSRPNVGAFVAPTTIRFLVLIGALLSTGLFMGNWLHNETGVGNDWAQRVAECYANASSLRDQDWLEQARARQACTAGVEARRFVYVLGGACLTLLASLGVVLAVPRVIERRRRLRPVDSRLAPAIEKLRAFAREAGLANEPALMMGAAATLRDGFSYGIPGRYRIALSPAILVRWRDSATFDPLLRHELAHLKNHDVPLAWMARSMWLVVVPVLALPLVWWILSGDLSAISSYVWRAVLLAAVTLLASSTLLRSREHDADLGASRSPESAAELKNLLQRVSTPARTRWRKVIAYHPTPAERLAIVSSPARHARVTFVDGLTAAFLAGLTLPLLTAAVSTILPGLAFVIPATLVGMLLGSTVGLGLWRQSLVQRVAGGVVHVAPVASGVLIGSTFGLAASLAGSGVAGVGGHSHLAVNLVTPLALCGATLIAAGLGELFADAVPRFRTPRRGWISCVALVGLLFAVALWVGLNLSLAWDEGGWSLVSVALLTVLTPGPALVALALAVASGYAMRPHREGADAPHWAVVGNFHPPWPPLTKPRILGTLIVGIAGGTMGTLMIIVFALVTGPAAGDVERMARAEMFMWLMAAVGGAAATALVLLQPARGLGTGLLASPVASVTAVIGFLIFNTARGGGLELAFVLVILVPSLAVGFMFTLVIALASTCAASPVCVWREQQCSRRDDHSLVGGSRIAWRHCRSTCPDSGGLRLRRGAVIARQLRITRQQLVIADILATGIVHPDSAIDVSRGRGPPTAGRPRSNGRSCSCLEVVACTE